MKKRVVSLVLMCAMLISCFCLTSFAASWDSSVNGSTVNGINLKVSASAAGGSASYAWCSSATSTCATLSVYNSSGTRVDYDIAYGSIDARTDSAVLSASYAKGSSSATISGTTRSGPSSPKVNYS